jgi:GNAT superfamily N-acetyltransferase
MAEPRSVRDRVIELVEQHEPASTRIVADLLHLDERKSTVALVEDAGAIAGLVVTTRICPGRWYASPFLADPAAAPALAAWIDRGPAWVVEGTAPHVLPLVDGITRARPPASVPFHGAAEPVPAFIDPDSRTRRAGPGDLDALVELYDGFKLDPIPTRLRWKAFLRHKLATEPVVVAEVDGRLVGAMRLDWASRRFAFWWGLMVRPEYRGLGLGNAVMARGMEIAEALDLRMCGTIGPTNPMTIVGSANWAETVAEDRHWQQDWVVLWLQPPQQFRGHHKVRRAWERAEALL